MATSVPQAEISTSSYATPASLSDLRIHHLPVVAKVYVNFTYGKQHRTVVVEMGREQLLTMIANAADALRLLDQEEKSHAPRL